MLNGNVHRGTAILLLSLRPRAMKTYHMPSKRPARIAHNSPIYLSRVLGTVQVSVNSRMNEQWVVDSPTIECYWAI